VKKIFFAAFVTLSFIIQLHSQPLIKPGRVIFYNTENLFDTINDPETKDEEFLPSSVNQWNTKKYQTKLEHVSKVLGAMLDSIQPIAIGLAEVENKKVLEDLIAQPALKKFNLGIIHHDSPDERGIDVALLYNKDLVQEVFDAFLKVEFTFDETDKTRDIVYFKGFMTEEFPVYFFVNHWPSRRDKELGDKKRITAAMALKAKIDDIYKGEPFARIIVMGDFNDNPENKSLEYLCSGKRKYPAHQDLVNLMKRLRANNEFSLKYKDENDLFDELIVSKNLLQPENTYYIPDSKAHLFKPDWLLFKHPTYGLIPNRTYASGKWVGGYSDHLPIYLDIAFH
jgi:predicted extracellular nuclease